MAADQIALEVTNDVALPTKVALVDRIPWGSLKVGSSFPLNVETFGCYAVERVRMAISYRQKATTERFSVRKMPDGSYRCWRVA